MDLQHIASEALSDAGVKELRIGDRTYSLSLLPASKGIIVAQQLIKTFLPSLASLADNFQKEDMVMPEDMSMYTEVSMLLVSQMDKIDILKIIGLLLNDLQSDGVPVNFDVEFRGSYGNLIRLLEFSIKENFGSFFTDYLKAKGLEIPSLGSILNRKAQTSEG